MTSEVADLDGDGELEFIVKRMNMDDANNFVWIEHDKAYDVLRPYDLNLTERDPVWWIDVGANMVSGNSTENKCHSL